MVDYQDSRVRLRIQRNLPRPVSVDHTQTWCWWVAHWAAVNGEQQRSKYWTLGYADFQLGLRRLVLDELFAVCSIWLDP